MGPMIFGCYGLREPSEQGHHGSYVLACSGEVQEASIVLNDPLVYVMSDGTRTATVSMPFDLALELESSILDLLLPCP